MADAYLQLPPDSTGKKLRAFGPLADGSYVEGVLLTDANGDSFPEDPVVSALTSLALAAGASVDLDATLITTGRLGRLAAVTVAASVPLKAQIRTMPGATIVDTVFTSEVDLTHRWTTPHPNFVTQDGGGGGRFRITITNLDTIDPGDVYATAYFDEV